MHNFIDGKFLWHKKTTHIYIALKSDVFVFICKNILLHRKPFSYDYAYIMLRNVLVFAFYLLISKSFLI